jgi:membrane protein
MTAMGPVLYICAWLAGLVFGNKAAHTHLVHEVRRVVGHDTAAMLQAAIEASGKIHGGFWPTLVGVAVLVFTAGGVFVEVQAALNCIWKVPPPPFTLWQMLRSWLQSIALVGGVAVLLCVSLLVNALVGAFGPYFERLIGIGGGVIWLINSSISATLITGLFAAIYRVLPNRALEWRDVLVGAAITTALILIGEYLIALYLAMSSLGNRYGSAGGAIAFLLWLYYSAQVFLLGAELTKVWSKRYGSPAARAVAATRYRLDRAA